LVISLNAGIQKDHRGCVYSAAPVTSRMALYKYVDRDDDDDDNVLVA